MIQVREETLREDALGRDDRATAEFVCLRNIKTYTRQLRAASDAERRDLLMKLLAEEAERARRADVIPLLF